MLGDDIMINVRKLRVLQRKGDAMERQKVVEKTRKYLASVGDRIKAVATQERKRRDLWQVRQLTECGTHALNILQMDASGSGFCLDGAKVTGQQPSSGSMHECQV